jgi:hypothetical protein
MKLNSRLTKQSKSLLDKVIRLYNAKQKNAINFEVNGERYEGINIEEISLSEGQLSFKVNGNVISFNVSNIFNVKRLRTRKFLFIIKDNKIESEGIIEDDIENLNDESKIGE